MAKPEQHVAQWRHNRDLLPMIPPTHPDWKVTVVFYVALHAVDALLYADGNAVTSHDSRNHILKVTTRYQKVWSTFGPLHGLARTVRYYADPVDWVPDALIESDVYKKLLYPIENSIARIQPRLGITPAPIPAAAQNPGK